MKPVQGFINLNINFANKIFSGLFQSNTYRNGPCFHVDYATKIEDR